MDCNILELIISSIADLLKYSWLWVIPLLVGIDMWRGKEYFRKLLELILNPIKNFVKNMKYRKIIKEIIEIKEYKELLKCFVEHNMLTQFINFDGEVNPNPLIPREKPILVDIAERGAKLTIKECLGAKPSARSIMYPGKLIVKISPDTLQLLKKYIKG